MATKTQPTNYQSQSNEEIKKISEIIEKHLNAVPQDQAITQETRSNFVKYLADNLVNSLSNNFLRERLDIIYDYEKKYLELTKDYKEEIKFAANLQEDIRKERSKFFSEVLQDVHKTLEDVKMDKKTTDVWITELVTSYTKSLDISSELSKDHIMKTMANLRESSRENISKVSDKETQD